MKALIVAGSVVLAIVLCVILGGKMVKYFQGELGVEQDMGQMSSADRDKVREAMTEQEAAEEEARRLERRKERAYLYETENKMDIPRMREIYKEDAFDGQMTAKQMFLKITTWGTLGIVAFVGWMIYIRFKKR